MSYSERIHRQILEQLKAFDELFLNSSPQQWAHRSGRRKWNALECVAHLNISLEYYNRQIGKGISRSKAKGQIPNEDYQPGAIGAWLARFLAPREGIVRRRVKTLPPFRPSRYHGNGVEILEAFRNLMEKLDELAQRASEIDLDKTRVRSTFGNILRFKMGDAFPIVLAHNERHLLQARKALETQEMPVPA